MRFACPDTRRPEPRSRARRRTLEAGFGIIEVVVAASILMVAGVAFASVVTTGSHVATSNEARLHMQTVANGLLQAARNDPTWVDDCRSQTTCSLTSALRADFDKLAKPQDGSAAAPFELGYSVAVRGVDSEGDGVGSADSDGVRPDYGRISVSVWANDSRGNRVDDPKFPPVTVSAISTPRSSRATGAVTLQVCGVYPQVDERLRVNGCAPGAAPLLLDGDCSTTPNPGQRPDLVALCNARSNAASAASTNLLPVRGVSVTIVDRLGAVVTSTRTDADGVVHAASLDPRNGPYRAQLQLMSATLTNAAGTTQDVARPTWSLWTKATSPGPLPSASNATTDVIQFNAGKGQHVDVLAVYRRQLTGNVRIRLGTDRTPTNGPSSDVVFTGWDHPTTNSAPWMINDTVTWSTSLFSNYARYAATPGQSFDDEGGYWVRLLPAPLGRDAVQPVDSYPSDAARRAAGWQYVCRKASNYRNTTTSRAVAATYPAAGDGPAQCADNAREEHRILTAHSDLHPRISVRQPRYRYNYPLVRYHEFVRFVIWTRTNTNNGVSYKWATRTWGAGSRYDTGTPGAADCRDHGTNWSQWPSCAAASETPSVTPHADGSWDSGDCPQQVQKETIAGVGNPNCDSANFTNCNKPGKGVSCSHSAMMIQCHSGPTPSGLCGWDLQYAEFNAAGDWRCVDGIRIWAFNKHADPQGSPVAHQDGSYAQWMCERQGYGTLAGGPGTWNYGPDCGPAVTGIRGPVNCELLPPSQWTVATDEGVQDPAHLHDQRFGDARPAHSPAVATQPGRCANASISYSIDARASNAGTTASYAPSAVCFANGNYFSHTTQLCCAYPQSTYPYGQHREWVEFTGVPEGLYGWGLLRDRMNDGVQPQVVPMAGSSSSRFVYVDPGGSSVPAFSTAAGASAQAVALTSCAVNGSSTSCPGLLANASGRSDGA